MQTLASDGELLALNDIVDVAAVESGFPASLVGLVSVGDSLYGIPGTTAAAGLVWYNPTQYDGPTSGTLDVLAAWTTAAAVEGRAPF